MADWNYSSPKKQPNPAFKIGLISGLVMAGMYTLLYFLAGMSTRLDIIAWIIQLAVYFFSARSASQKMYQQQMDGYEPLNNVQASGTGAAIVICLVIWAYFLIRSLVMSAFEVYIIDGPFLLCGAVIFDMLIAIGLGSLGGNSVVKQYRINSDY